MKRSNRNLLMRNLQNILVGRPLTEEEREYHVEAGESFHVPVIVHRSGGVSANMLNACGICGAQLAKHDGRWIAISNEAAEAIREKRPESKGEKVVRI